MLDPISILLISASGFLGLLASDQIGHRFKPDDQPGDPVGSVTVYFAHIGVGVVIVTLLAGVFDALAGQFPGRWALLAACCAGPAAFELAQYRRFGGLLRDKIVDAVAMCLTPIGACLTFVWQGGVVQAVSFAPATLTAAFAVVLGGALWWWRA